MKKKLCLGGNLFWSLLLLMLSTTVYDFIVIHYAGIYRLSLNLLGQIEWFDLISETLHMFLIMPLYYLINQYCKKNECLQKESKGVLSALGLISCGIYIMFSAIVFVGIPLLVSAMKVSNDKQTILYLKLETIAFALKIIYDFCFVVFVNIGKKWYIYLILGMRLGIYILANQILIPILGEIGIAVSEVASAMIMSVVLVGILYIKGYLGRPHLEKFIISHWVKEGIFQGCSVLIDNLAYVWRICRIVNRLQGMGSYWIANNFIWSILLLPCAVMAELIRKECNDKQFRMRKYYKWVVWTLIVWFVTAFGWKWFIGNVMMVSNTQTVYKIVVYLVPYYIFYMCSQVIDNYFLGTGNSKYIAINSLIVNGVYYGVMFILYDAKIITPNIDFVICMFGFGMVIHFIVSAIEYRIFVSRKYRLLPKFLIQ